MLYHRNLDNLNFLWDQLLIKQITNLHYCLNAIGPEEAVTNIRIEDGLLLIGTSKGTWQNNIPKASARLWKNNLACLTMLRAKDSQLAFSFNYKNSIYNDKSTRIHEILETKFIPL